MNVQIHPRFMLLLILTSFSEVNSAPAAGTGLSGGLAVEGILKRLFSPGLDLQRRVTVALQLFPSSSGAGAWGILGWDLIRLSPTQLSLFRTV